MYEISTATDRPDPLSEVRRTGGFIISALLWAAAGAGLFFLAGYGLIAFYYLIELSEKLRRALGLSLPPTGPDWYLLTALGVILAGVVALVCLLLGWYRAFWRRRLTEFWRDAAKRKSLARRQPVLPQASDDKDEFERRLVWLRALLQTQRWSPHWEQMKRAGGQNFPRDISPVSIASEAHDKAARGYQQVAEAVLRALEAQVAERAIATGLIVGISQNRLLDSLTIVFAALELQLFVLSSLGKQASWATWRELVKRAGASLFFNTYLNREETLLASWGVKKAAIALHASADVIDNAGEALTDADVEELLDAIFETVSETDGGTISGIIKGVVQIGSDVAGYSLGFGAAGLKQIAELIEKIGDDLLQGMLAGAVIYHHGMALAASVLALDEEHLRQRAMRRSVKGRTPP